jgi:hypothetical protein
MGTARFVAAGVLASLCVACGEAAEQSSPPTSIEPRVEAATTLPSPDLSGEIVFVPSTAEAAFPMETATDFVTYADQLSLFTVVSERNPERTADDSGIIPRYVTLRAVKNLWLGPRSDRGVIVKEGDQVEIVTWGSVGTTEDGAIRMLTGFGEPMLEVGGEYLGGLVMSSGAFGTYPGSVARSNGDYVSPGDGWMFAPAAPSAQVAISAVVDELDQTSPDSRIGDTALSEDEFFSLDPWDRVLAIARTTNAVDDAADSTVPSG